MADLFDMEIKRAAIVSDCGRYRYRLRREWDCARASACFIMVNPSTADGHADDNTIRRCIRFAHAWGYGALDVVNLSPWRATDPDQLKAIGTILFHGPMDSEHILINDAAIMTALTEPPRPKIVVAAWGALPHTPSYIFQRSIDVLKILNQLGIGAHCLGLTSGHGPRHPLYVRKDAALEPYP